MDNTNPKIYIDTNNFEDIQDFKEKYEKIYGEIEFDELIKKIYLSTIYMYLNFIIDFETYKDNSVYIAFSFFTMNNIDYIFYSKNSNNEKYISNFKNKLAAYNYDPNNFDEFSESEIIKRCNTGKFEIIYKLKTFN